MRAPASAGRCGSPPRAQSAGRGRRGNAWVSAPGNLYATLLLTEPSAPAQAPQLSFVAALALHDAVSECAPQLAPALTVKWPNDLLLGGKKLAGILIEGDSEKVFRGRHRHRRQLRLASSRALTIRPTDLAASGAQVAPERLFAALVQAMERRLTQWQRRRGLRVHPRRLAQARGRSRARTSACGCRSANCPAASKGSMRPGVCCCQGAGGVTTVTAGEVFGL